MTFNKNKIVEKSIIILILLLAFFSVKYYKISNDFQTFIGTVELEKKVLDSQLAEILNKYDSISLKNKLDSIKYNEQISLLQKGTTSSEFTNSPEKKEIYYSQQKDDRVKNILNSKSEKLTALNINVKGVKIYSNNYELKDNRIQQLRVCFTLEENHLVKSGQKTFYVQVVNPKNQIISSENTSIESDEKVKLQYSASVDANYQKKDTDVCTYVNLEQKKTIKGRYKINIYHDFVKIGTTIFEY